MDRMNNQLQDSFSNSINDQLAPIEKSVNQLGTRAGNLERGAAKLEVRAGPENGSHSKRSAALSSWSLELRFGYVTDPTLVPTISKAERPTRRNDAHGSL